MKAARWLLVVPAALFGLLALPLILHLMWEIGWLIMPHWEFFKPVVEMVKSALGGVGCVALGACPRKTLFVIMLTTSSHI